MPDPMARTVKSNDVAAAVSYVATVTVGGFGIQGVILRLNHHSISTASVLCVGALVTMVFFVFWDLAVSMVKIDQADLYDGSQLIVATGFLSSALPMVSILYWIIAALLIRPRRVKKGF
jgi:hypothetical protein